MHTQHHNVSSVHSCFIVHPRRTFCEESLKAHDRSANSQCTTSRWIDSNSAYNFVGQYEYSSVMYSTTVWSFYYSASGKTRFSVVPVVHHSPTPDYHPCACTRSVQIPYFTVWCFVPSLLFTTLSLRSQNTVNDGVWHLLVGDPVSSAACCSYRRNVLLFLMCLWLILLYGILLAHIQHDEFVGFGNFG